MLTGDDGLPLAEPPQGYPLAFPRTACSWMTPAMPATSTARVTIGVRRGLRQRRRRDAGRRPRVGCARETAISGGGWRRSLRQHLRAYSKSRRRAPIYWQLGTPSGSYSVWLYYHRFTRDTLYAVVNDYVTPKLRHEERQLTGLVQESGSHPTPSQRREIAAQETFVEELRAFREELARVAPLWNPDLNDGVIINFAPLWRLIPQHKAWQRQVKACWDKLVAGDYDWAHLAMHLWPERVVPKCATDRSLAIAHGLEDAFWVEGDDGKWQQRDVSAETVEDLVRERSSEAVKAALTDLMQAPASGVGGTRGGRRKTNSQPKRP